MKSINKILVLIITVIAILLNYSVPYACKDIDLFQDMINKSEGHIVESGVRTCFISAMNGQELQNYILKKIRWKNTKVKSYKNKENYYIDIKSSDITGFISITRAYDESLVTIDILKKGSNNELENIKNSIESVIKPINHHKSTYYEYVKAKLPDKDLASLNKELAWLLKSYGATNINSVELNNGFSSTAYTGKFNSKINNGKLMDLNYALSSYTSGKYIIIGTPEIIIAY